MVELAIEERAIVDSFSFKGSFPQTIFGKLITYANRLQLPKFVSFVGQNPE